jgi:hypothetical protein
VGERGSHPVLIAGVEEAAEHTDPERTTGL